MTFRLNQLSTVTTVAALLAMSMGLLGACGGRSRVISGDDDDTVPGAGASSAGASNVGRAGAASGGAVTSGGAPSSGGAVATAGAPSAHGGSSSQCNNVSCALPTCVAGYELRTLPGSCCPICQPACTPAAGCPAIGCGSGTHLETPAGACCPVCVDDPGITCAEGMKSYNHTRAQLLEKYMYGCKSDADCVVLAPANRCESGCQYATVWYSVADSFIDNLANSADQSCANCVPGPVPPCAPPRAAGCLMGQCAFLTLK